MKDKASCKPANENNKNRQCMNKGNARELEMRKLVLEVVPSPIDACLFVVGRTPQGIANLHLQLVLIEQGFNFHMIAAIT